MSDQNKQCAVWWMRYGSAGVDVYDSEQEAAEDAVIIDRSEQAAVAGVQYSDGSFTDTAKWEAYRVEDRRRDEEDDRLASEMAARPKPATRTVQAPFDNDRTVDVPVDAPSWLGRQR